MEVYLRARYKCISKLGIHLHNLSKGILFLRNLQDIFEVYLKTRYGVSQN